MWHINVHPQRAVPVCLLVRAFASVHDCVIVCVSVCMCAGVGGSWAGAETAGVGNSNRGGGRERGRDS